MLALMLASACIYIAIKHPNDPLGATGAALFSLTGGAVGFFFGGHVAQNTAALEEQRQVKATDAAEASALRSEAAAPSIEK
jgi:hypothetical protein